MLQGLGLFALPLAVIVIYLWGNFNYVRKCYLCGCMREVVDCNWLLLRVKFHCPNTEDEYHRRWKELTERYCNLHSQRADEFHASQDTYIKDQERRGVEFRRQVNEMREHYL